MTNKILSAGFIVTDNDAIWGVGTTETAAWSDFLENMANAGIAVVTEKTYDEHGFLDQDQTLESQYQVIAATSALLSSVKDSGGNISWGKVGVVCCTNDEEHAACVPECKTSTS